MMNKEESQIRIERVDDIPVLYGLLEQMGIQEIVDSEINRHGNWAGLSPGWVITLWLVHILSEQNHVMEPVQQWVGRHLYTLRKLSGQEVRELDFTDDRLALCLSELSVRQIWQGIEERLGVRLVRVYALKPELIRLDATANTVHHEQADGTLFKLGKAKNGLHETQFKTMMASLDPMGLPLAVDIVAGNRADDPLYIPSYQRVKKILAQDGLLVVGDSKMSALLTRGTIAAGGDYYLTPLADQKDDPELLGELLAGWLKQNAEAQPLFLPEDRPSDGSAPELTLAIGCGFEVSRPQSVRVDEKEVRWDERLLVVRSYSYQKSILAGLHRRLAKAEAALVALTPPRQRGKQQMTEEAQLLTAIKGIEQQYRVQGFFAYEYQQEVSERKVRAYQGKPPRVERQVRFHLTVSRNQAALERVEFEAGWRIYATNAPTARLPLEEAVLAYRGQITQENIFRRLNGKMLSITPLYVQRQDHAQGLVHLLTLGSRLLSLGDFLAKKALAQAGEELAGVYPGNPKRSTSRPTTERMLKAFEGIDLLFFSQGDHSITHLTALQPVHKRILALLGLNETLFSALQSA